MAPTSKPSFQGQIAIIIPAYDEEACLGQVLDELLAEIDREKFIVAVGVNASGDRTAEIARSRGVWVAETPKRGYGHGCQSAIDLLSATGLQPRAYIFFAGDGASDPRDLRRLMDAYEQGHTFVLGARTGQLRNWRTMPFSHVVANFAIALWCGMLAGRWFKDLAPLRLIDRRLFELIAPREMTFGWTIEPQIAAARLGAAMCEIPASERLRLAGTQKVSGVTARQTFVIGCRILAAGWRAWRRFHRGQNLEPTLIAQPQRSV